MVVCSSYPEREDCAGCGLHRLGGKRVGAFFTHDDSRETESDRRTNQAAGIAGILYIFQQQDFRGGVIGKVLSINIFGMRTTAIIPCGVVAGLWNATAAL